MAASLFSFVFLSWLANRAAFPFRVRPLVQKPSLSVVSHPQTPFYFDFLKMYPPPQRLRINVEKFEYIQREHQLQSWCVHGTTIKM